jgi:hypothetical protein
MTGSFSTATRLALVLAVPAWLAASAATAQEKVAHPGGGDRGGARSAPPPSAPSGGGATASGSPSGAGSTGGGGSTGGAVTRGEDGGGRRGGGATGSSGHAAPREGRTANSGGNAGTATPRGSSAGMASGGEGHVNSAVPSGERGRRAGAGEATGRAANTGNGGSGVPTYARPVEAGERVGRAVPRPPTPQPPAGGVGIFVPGGYYGPYGYGYGYYDPWAYGAAGYGFYGGYYDPWYGGYPADPQGGTYTPSIDEGKLRLKIKPREAEVYVDGYYVGQVDDFDGIFQRLHLDSGAHRIEVRAPGYESLSFDVRIAPDQTTTYQGELKKLQ